MHIYFFREGCCRNEAWLEGGVANGRIKFIDNLLKISLVERAHSDLV